MADKVVLDQEEMNTFTESLIEYHKEIATGITRVKGYMDKLNGQKDIFSMKQTSQRIATLLDTIEQDIMPLLQNTLWESNQCADTFIQIMNSLDQ